jgi:hypothetical protein
MNYINYRAPKNSHQSTAINFSNISIYLVLYEKQDLKNIHTQKITFNNEKSFKKMNRHAN